jgi:hypothetical protein
MVEIVGEAVELEVGNTARLDGARVGGCVAGRIPSYMSKPGANTKGVHKLIQQ